MAVGTQRDVRSKYETLLTIKEIATMKKYEVEMDIHFTKAVHIEAPNEDAAITLAETMLLCTDALPLTDEDMIDLITTATEQGKKTDSGAVPADAEDDDDEFFCCGDCTVCGLCDEDGDDADEDADEDEEDRIDELLHQLMEALEDVTAAMGSAIKVADALKELTGEDIFSQLMR